LCYFIFPSQINALKESGTLKSDDELAQMLKRDLKKRYESTIAGAIKKNEK